ncbi:MAG: glycosyltransferase family 39 protein [Anaerolineales bacterium]|nr:glycosyltransferase family 39 protein [Anaerolineales bacterium]
MPYPFELEWIEGGMVDQVQRIVDGNSVYTAPSINFVPFLYPPLYFYLSALVSPLLGGGLLPLRLVSFIASLISFTTIFLIVYDETKSWWASLLSTSLFVASFRITGAWLDIARVDSLFLTLWLLFVFFIRRQKTPSYAILTGLLAAATFLTKQTALIACLPAIFYFLIKNRKYALILLAATTVTIGAVTLALNLASEGWYSYYIFGLLFQQTEWLKTEMVTMWRNDLLIHAPLAILVALFFFANKTNQDRSIYFQWAVISAGALAGTFLTRVKEGGYDNVLLPAYAIISILFGLGLNELMKISKQLETGRKTRMESMIHIACLIQLIILFYNPYEQIPTNADLKAGHELIQFISNFDGNVYIADHGYLSTLAGKKPYAHQSAIWDIVRGNKKSEGKALLRENLNDMIREQLFDVIILDSSWNYCCPKINQYYTKTETIFDEETMGFYPVTGWRRRPTIVYIANRLEQ